MRTRVMLGANRRPSTTPGGFAAPKGKHSRLYRNAADVKKAAIRVLESRGIYNVPDAFTAQQRIMSAERGART